MRATCHRHPHSTEETARKCWEKYMAKRVNSKLRYVDLSLSSYKQVTNNPPIEIKVGNISVYYFYSAIKLFNK